MSEEFWVCVACKSVHHYQAKACQKCGASLKKCVVDDIKSLQKLLGIVIPKRIEKKSQKSLPIE